VEGLAVSEHAPLERPSLASLSDAASALSNGAGSLGDGRGARLRGRP